jgi:hypothetical protein
VSTTGREAEIVTQVGPHDVLMGRGAPSSGHEGNRSLRQLVWEQRAKYTQTRAHRIKHQIAAGIIECLKSRGARFLQRIELPETSGSQANVVAAYQSATARYRIIKDLNLIFSKVKQLLRDLQPQTLLNRKLRKNTASPDDTQDVDEQHGLGSFAAAHRSVEGAVPQQPTAQQPTAQQPTAASAAVLALQEAIVQENVRSVVPGPTLDHIRLLQTIQGLQQRQELATLLLAAQSNPLVAAAAASRPNPGLSALLNQPHLPSLPLQQADTPRPLVGTAEAKAELAELIRVELRRRLALSGPLRQSQWPPPSGPRPNGGPLL